MIREFSFCRGRVRREYASIVKDRGEERAEIDNKKSVRLSLEYSHICPPMLPACFAAWSFHKKDRPFNQKDGHILLENGKELLNTKLAARLCRVGIGLYHLLWEYSRGNKPPKVRSNF